jgi:hypothetical protein
MNFGTPKQPRFKMLNTPNKPMGDPLFLPPVFEFYAPEDTPPTYSFSPGKPG